MMIWDWKRFLLHVPVGMFQSWLTHRNATAGVLFALGFSLYEMSEDWYLRDGAYIDIQGALAGEVLQALWEHRRKDSPLLEDFLEEHEIEEVYLVGEGSTVRVKGA